VTRRDSEREPRAAAWNSGILRGLTAPLIVGAVLLLTTTAGIIAALLVFAADVQAGASAIHDTIGFTFPTATHQTLQNMAYVISVYAAAVTVAGVAGIFLFRRAVESGEQDHAQTFNFLRVLCGVSAVGAIAAAIVAIVVSSGLAEGSNSGAGIVVVAAIAAAGIYVVWMSRLATLMNKLSGTMRDGDEPDPPSVFDIAVTVVAAAIAVAAVFAPISLIIKLTLAAAVLYLMTLAVLLALTRVRLKAAAVQFWRVYHEQERDRKDSRVPASFAYARRKNEKDGY
jgi:hypothetical protein